MTRSDPIPSSVLTGPNGHVHLAKFESMETMAAGIAHDFNNHAAAILGNNTLLTRLSALDTRSRECMARIDAAANQALQLAEQLATYAGRIICDPRPLTLRSLLASLQRACPPEQTVKLQIDPLPSPLPPLTADAALLERALRNLVTNAVEAMVEHVGAVYLSAGPYLASPEDAHHAFFPLDATPGWVELAVRDEGPGIAPAILHRVCDPFFSTKIRGRGMGLPEVIGIARLHGGNVLLHSARGSGTQVRLLLPPQPPA